VKAPDAPGSYVLIWDMVEERVTWFEWQGGPTLTVNVGLSGQRTYRATWLSHQTPTTLLPGETRANVAVKIRNDSNWTWPSIGTNRVRLSYHWLDGSGRTVVWDGARTALPSDLTPGAQAGLTATLRAPDAPGSYLLVWDMVEERIAWFEWRGNPTVTVSVTVRGLSLPAYYSGHMRSLQSTKVRIGPATSESASDTWWRADCTVE